MSSPDAIYSRFTRETAEHKMTVLHDNGLYRHLRFKAPNSSMYWFDLVTFPGGLLFQGDGQTFTFNRTEDMFEFFRGPVGRTNPGYWAEKVTSGREHLTEYDRDEFTARVNEALASALDDSDPPEGLAEAIQREVLGCEEAYYESGARQVLDYFEHDGFKFYDTYEWDLHRPKWWFLWSLHAIVWGIAQYDQHHGRGAAASRLTVPAPAPQVVTTETVGGVL